MKDLQEVQAKHFRAVWKCSCMGDANQKQEFKKQPLVALVIKIHEDIDLWNCFPVFLFLPVAVSSLLS